MSKKKKTEAIELGHDPAYRPCVGIVLLNKDGKVWVGRREGLPADDPHAWQMPQGGIDKRETPETAALRELEEEIGTNKARIVQETPHWLTYDLPEHLAGKAWKGKYKGQTQKWFLMEFTGKEKDINIQTDHPEFSEWRWEDLCKLPELVVPFKKTIYEELVSIFAEQVAQRS